MTSLLALDFERGPDLERAIRDAVDACDPATLVRLALDRELRGAGGTAAAATFHDSRLNWDEIAQPVHADLLAWYRRIIALKASAIRPLSQAAIVSYDEAASWLCFVLGDLCVAVNFATQPVSCTLPKGNWRLLLSSSDTSPSATQLAAYETRIHIQSL